MMIRQERSEDGRCAILTLSRPEALNALNGPLLDALDAALDRIEADESVHGFVIAGEGRAFCAGADLKEQLGDAMVRVRRMHDLVVRLRDFPKISVAAMDGHALGGGLELAMACTFRVAGPGALMGVPEIRMGLIPGFGGTQLLPRLVGRTVALEMLLNGRPVGPARAREIGLVSETTDEPGAAVAAALALLETMVDFDPLSQAAARRLVDDALTLSLEDGLAREREEVAQISARVVRTPGVPRGNRARA